MANWAEFVAGAPQVSETFLRRHAATGGLCMLATLRSDGSPRISPLEPRMFEGQLWLGGMPNTLKFRDLSRDPRFSLTTRPSRDDAAGARPTNARTGCAT